jgi:hypothetical protein
MKPCLLIFTLDITSINSARCQETPNLKADTTKAIDIITHYDGFYYEDKRSELGQYYQKFSHALSAKDLVELTDNWNPATRCYAFFALSERQSALLDSILLTHLQDTTHVFILLGDEGEHQTVGDFFYNVMTGNLFGGIEPNSDETYRLDSLILFRPGVLIEEKHHLIKTFQFKQSWMPRLREIAFVEKNDIAIISLAKYHDSVALPRIENLLKDSTPQLQTLGLVAVRNWPNPLFLPSIKKIQKTQMGPTAGYNFWQLRVLYQVIVLYKDSVCRENMLLALKKTKGWRPMVQSFAIWIALHKYPDHFYDPVLRKLKIASEHLPGLPAYVNENEDWEY